MGKVALVQRGLGYCGLAAVLLALAGCASMPSSAPSPVEPPPSSSEATGSSSPSGAEAPESQAEQSGQTDSSEKASGSAESEASGSQGGLQVKSNETSTASDMVGDAGAEAAGAEAGAATTQAAAATQPAGGASGDGAVSASTSANGQGLSGGQPGEVPGPVSVPRAGTGQGGGVQSDDALARLEAELEGSLQSFDQTLLEDRVALQTKIETGEDNSGSGATESGPGRSGGGWAPAEGDDPNGIDGGFGGEESQAGEGDQSIQSTGADGGLATTQRADGKTTRPPNIPPGDDDDIVARQLREAAERETDPQLREKLWEEYRAYKLNQSRGGDGAGT